MKTDKIEIIALNNFEKALHRVYFLFRSKSNKTIYGVFL